MQHTNGWQQTASGGWVYDDGDGYVWEVWRARNGTYVAAVTNPDGSVEHIATGLESVGDALVAASVEAGIVE